MLNVLFQRPVAKENDVAVVGISEEAGDAFGTAQLNIDVGVGGGTEGQGGKRKYGEFGHAQILFSVWTPRTGCSHTETDRGEEKVGRRKYRPFFIDRKSVV